MEQDTFSMRLFTIDEVEAYRAIRLEALELEKGMYGNSHALEAAMTDEEWNARIANPLHARFGLYHNNELVGLTAIIINKNNQSEAYMTQSYIRKAYRGQGLAKLLYDTRFSWARGHGVKRLEIGHRKGNAASFASIQKYGFSHTHSENRQWPDGEFEDMHYYELLL